MRIILFIVAIVGLVSYSKAQVLGGGTLFSNAVAFDQAWLSGCASGGLLYQIKYLTHLHKKEIVPYNFLFL